MIKVTQVNWHEPVFVLHLQVLASNLFKERGDAGSEALGSF